MSNEPTLSRMQLSNSEASLVQRLRRTEQAWHRVRWVIVIIGSLVFAGSFFMFGRIWNTVAPDQILLLLCLFAAPVSAIALVASLAAMIYAFRFWSGTPVHRLLLRLTDEDEAQRK